MDIWERIWLGIRVIFGRYDAPNSKWFNHPKYSPSQVLLRHKGFDWDTPQDKVDVMDEAEKQTLLAQVIHNAYYAMEAGRYPTKDEEQEPNGGDMQLAVDILNHFDVTPKE